MGIDVKPDGKISSADARRRGGLILLIACLTAPIGIIAWMTWGYFVGLCVYGGLVTLVALLWFFTLRQTSVNFNHDDF
jgi:hypothetical protein